MIDAQYFISRFWKRSAHRAVCATVIPICYTVLRPTVNAGHRGELTGQKLCDQRTVGSEHHVTSQEIPYSPINQ